MATAVKIRARVDELDNNRATASHFASWSGQTNICRILLEGARRYRCKGRVGGWALAVQAGRVDAVDILLEGRAKVEANDN
jgi:ankyrin repeat protein